MGKSTLAAGLRQGRRYQEQHGRCSSAGDGRNEITATAVRRGAVPLQTMRTGQMKTTTGRLARRMIEVAEPLVHTMTLEHVNDGDQGQVPSPEARTTEVRHHRLPELMSRPSVENRQQEVSEMSRSLKLLAGNRSSQSSPSPSSTEAPSSAPTRALHRTCASPAASRGHRILRADTGAEITLGDLLASGAKSMFLFGRWTNACGLCRQIMTHAFPSGSKRCSGFG